MTSPEKDQPLNRTFLTFIVIALIASILMTCGTEQNVPVDRSKVLSEQLTFKWQYMHCPVEAQVNLKEILLADGKISDVEILDVPDERIYLPRPWTTNTQYFYGLAPDGMSTRTGGAGTFKPWRGPGTDTPCRGQAFTSIPYKPGVDPRFTLDLVFRQYTTQSPIGNVENQKGKYPFAHQLLGFVFLGPEDRNRNLSLLRISFDQPSETLGDGWRFVRRNTRSSLDRLAFDEQARQLNKPVSKAVEVLEGWALVFPLADNVMAKVVVGRDVPVTRWRLYQTKAENVYRWLKTKPAERGTLPLVL